MASIEYISFYHYAIFEMIIGDGLVSPLIMLKFKNTCKCSWSLVVKLDSMMGCLVLHWIEQTTQTISKDPIILHNSLITRNAIEATNQFVVCLLQTGSSEYFLSSMEEEFL